MEAKDDASPKDEASKKPRKVTASRGGFRRTRRPRVKSAYLRERRRWRPKKLRDYFR